jgi:hypothetical protein
MTNETVHLAPRHQVTVDINGDIVRAQLGASSVDEAIDLLTDRLRARWSTAPIADCVIAR